MCVYFSDIKPANYLSNEDNTSLCLVDFGGAMDIRIEDPVCVEDQEKATFQVAQRILAVDKICPRKCEHIPLKMPARGGTEGYRAPEVLMGADHQAYASVCIGRYHITYTNCHDIVIYKYFGMVYIQRTELPSIRGQSGSYYCR